MEEGGSVIFSLCKATKGLHPPRGGGVSLNSTRALDTPGSPASVEHLAHSRHSEVICETNE